MKKFITIGIVLSLMIGCYTIANGAETQSDTKALKAAIAKYKNKNFLGCISDLRQYVAKDQSDAAAWYYLGNAYMNISMIKDAHYAFDKVIQLNTIPQLTSYSIQAKLCMENPVKCQYYTFNKQEIAKLKADPKKFLTEYVNSKNLQVKNTEQQEIDKLIKGGYGSKIHPSAQNVILQEHTNMKQNEINNYNKAAIEENEKYAAMIEKLKRDTEISSMAMMLDLQDNNTQKNNYNDYLMMNYSKMTPEMIQTMMMNNMMMPTL